MQIARTLLIIGIWVAVLPYLGFPMAIKNILFVITGLALVYISLLFYKKNTIIVKNKKRNRVTSPDNFSENIPPKVSVTETTLTEEVIEIEPEIQQN